MKCDLIITINVERIVIEYPQSAEKTELVNRVGYDKSRLAIKTVGKTEKELKASLDSDWVSFQQKIAFVRVFDPQAKGPIFDYQVMEYLFTLARQKLFSSQAAQKFAFLAPALEVHLKIEGYERLSIGRQRELEYYLQDFQNVKSLQINQRDCTIPTKLRVLQSAGALVLRVLLPALVLYIGLFTLTRAWDQDVVFFAVSLAANVLAAGLVYFVGTALWLVLFRRLLPHGYLRYQLRSGPKFLRFASRWVAARLLD